MGSDSSAVSHPRAGEKELAKFAVKDELSGSLFAASARSFVWRRPPLRLLAAVLVIASVRLVAFVFFSYRAHETMMWIGRLEYLID